MTEPYRYIDDDQFCLSARLLPDLNNGGDTDTLSITIEGSDEPQSVHVRAVDAPVVAAGIVRAAGQQPAAVPAVVPPATHGAPVLPVSGRAATLLWAADRLERHLEDFFREWPEERQNSPWVLGWKAAQTELRRLVGEAEQPGKSTAEKAYDLGLTDAEYRAQSHAAAVAAVRAAIPGMYAHVGLRLEDVLNEAAADQPARAARQDPTPDDFTEARAAFMNIGRTPSLEGLRTELHIEGRPILIGRYCGAEMGRMHDVPGYEHVLSIKPQLLFEYADEPPAVSSGQPDTNGKA